MGGAAGDHVVGVDPAVGDRRVQLLEVAVAELASVVTSSEPSSTAPSSDTLPAVANAASRACRPRSITTSRLCSANHCWIRTAAFGVRTEVSQSRDGPGFSDSDVRISTRSPSASGLDSRTSPPLTRAPIVRWPTDPPSAYARSTGVEPAGSGTASPSGVNTKTSAPAPRSSRKVRKNSAASATSRCQASSRRSHPMSRPPSAPSAPGRSAACRCAATPCSATRCIESVRMSTSTGSPPGPSTVVCSDW